MADEIMTNQLLGIDIVCAPKSGGNSRLSSIASNSSKGKIEKKNSWNWTAPFSQKYDSANAIHITKNDEIFIAGTYGSFSTHDGDVWAAKLDKTSSMLWFKKFDANNSWDFGRAIAEAANGDIFIAGGAHTSDSDGANHHGWILRIDRDGNLIWSKIFGGDPTRYFAFSSVFAMEDGGAILLGESHPENGLDTHIWLVRISSDGSIIWEKHIPPNFMTRNGNLNTNNLIVDNEFIIFSANFGESWILKYSLDGNLIWRRSFSQSGWSSIHNIKVDSNRNVVAVGHVRDHVSRSSSAWILKLDNDGRVIWERLYGREEDANVMRTLCIEDNDNITVAGFSGESYMGEINGWLLSLDSEGIKINEQIIDFNLEDRITSISYSSSGCLVGAGTTSYTKNDKTMAWVHRFK